MTDIPHRMELLALAEDIRNAGVPDQVVTSHGNPAGHVCPRCVSAGLSHVHPDIIWRALNITVLIANALPADPDEIIPLFKDSI